MADFRDRLLEMMWAWLADRFECQWRRCNTRSWNAGYRLRIREAIRSGDEAPF